MCGRYSFVPQKKQMAAIAPELALPSGISCSYNIAPVQLGLVLAQMGSATPIYAQMQWGLVPSWSKDGKNSGSLINARAETVAEKPSFRDALQQKRCLVPADSFYEWRAEPDGTKTPYRIFLQSEELIFMAGIWDEWQGSHGRLRSFSIITTTPNAEMSQLHNRMPVIFTNPSDRKSWLSDAPLEALLPLLKPLPDGQLAMYRVSNKLNKPDYDAPDLHVEVPEVWRLF